MSLFKKHEAPVERPSRFEMPAVEAMNRERMSVAIAVDVSSSLPPEAMRNVVANLNRFKGIVCQDEKAAKCVDVCVVSFADQVKVEQDWLPIADMRSFEFAQGGCTDLDGAVMKAAEMIREHSRRYAEAGIVEKKPYLIVMTDGMDTVKGNVDAAADYVARRERDGKLKVFFLGFGDYDRATAAQLTAGSGCAVFEVDSGSYDFTDFFDFAGNSVKAASLSAPGAKLPPVSTPINTPASNTKAVNLDEFLNR
ncbi:vWA domain-containing protein [Arabiibacter massiliensis]|uniref:vWA domain-containing protein n=1 Tax=Arabiibacter massiliensis TaxID=1870985 RepID=UPI0009BB957B|nr:VWA domain-containing protein [Arabiibacter massiliensis]